jgi:hypothetical protein
MNTHTHTERLTPVDVPEERVMNRQEVDDTSTDERVSSTAPATVSGATLATNIIWYIAGLLEILLAFRFVFALLGANPANGFANFIYSVSYPFVAPFFGLFGYTKQYGVSRFESYTLVAMLVYLVAAWLITRLFTLNRPRTRAVV